MVILLEPKLLLTGIFGFIISMILSLPLLFFINYLFVDKKCIIFRNSVLSIRKQIYFDEIISATIQEKNLIKFVYKINDKEEKKYFRLNFILDKDRETLYKILSNKLGNKFINNIKKEINK
ncbi:hypothetical protein [Arcobacter vandammei]|uniref:hypothetical protein n=1 Tax=Arcobacter vandammei TaxID=2782243 RepID=UPI0018E03B3A|nr:hypothetical protein [Arcobacter vandammei]